MPCHSARCGASATNVEIKKQKQKNKWMACAWDSREVWTIHHTWQISPFSRHFLSHGRCCRVNLTACRQVSLSLRLGWHKPLCLPLGNYAKIITVRCKTVIHFLGKWCRLRAMHTHSHACTHVNHFSLQPPGFTLTGLAELALLPALRPKTNMEEEPGVCYWPCFCHSPIHIHRGRNEFWFGGMLGWSR